MTPPPGARAFLDAHGWSGAAIRPLAGDASFRRYFRVEGADNRRAVLMDAPPPEDCGQFLAVAAHLRSHGFTTPKVLATDREQGLLLLEDFGDARMAEAMAADPAIEEPVYAAAIDLLVALHAHPAPAILPPYDRAIHRREVGLVVDWYAPALEIAVDAASYGEAWDAVLAPVETAAAAAPVTVLRDYHPENVMLLGGRDGRPDAIAPATLGLLDFQDALAGHPTYDLVSLLQDARRDVSPALETAMLTRYRAARPFDDAAYAVLGAQRNAKILGLFTRLWRRDGKPRYLRYQRRVWGYLERDLAHPALEPVRAWFDANLPRAARAEAWPEDAA